MDGECGDFSKKKSSIRTCAIPDSPILFGDWFFYFSVWTNPACHRNRLWYSDAPPNRRRNPSLPRPHEVVGGTSISEEPNFAFINPVSLCNPKEFQPIQFANFNPEPIIKNNYCWIFFYQIIFIDPVLLTYFFAV